MTSTKPPSAYTHCVRASALRYRLRVRWHEVEHALKKKNAALLVFESAQVLSRVEKIGDLFAPVLTLKQKLPKLAGIKEMEPEPAEGLELAAQAEEPVKRAKKARKPVSALKKKAR